MEIHTVVAAGALIVGTQLGCSTGGRDGTTPQSTARLPTSATAPATGTDASTTPTSSSSAEQDHEDGWRAIVAAMQTGDVAKVKGYTTEAGYQSLLERVVDEEPAVAFKRWGNIWAGWEIRWESATASEARANIGPKVKAHGISLVKDGATWKLDRWRPGS